MYELGIFLLWTVQYGSGSFVEKVIGRVPLCVVSWYSNEHFDVILLVVSQSLKSEPITAVKWFTKSKKEMIKMAI